MSSNDTRDPSATDPSLEQRVEELEIRAAFQERALEELDEVVRQYADKVARLERELDALQGRVAGVEASPPAVSSREDD